MTDSITSNINTFYIKFHTCRTLYAVNVVELKSMLIVMDR